MWECFKVLNGGANARPLLQVSGLLQQTGSSTAHTIAASETSLVLVDDGGVS